MVSLNPAVLLAAETGRGALPDGFVSAFTRLANSLDREAGLTLVGRRLVQNQLLRVLYGRRALERAPAVPELGVPRVVVIVGLPRTGTTLLHHLLARRFVTDFVPLPEALEPFGARAGGGVEDRRTRARSYLEFLDCLSPTLRALHPMTVDGPEECDVPMQVTGVSDWFSIAHRIPTYTRWAERADRTDAYDAYRRVLCHLRPRAEVVVLKSPSHLAHLGELLGRFPHCAVVWLHRPTAEVVPSFVRLVGAARTVTSDPDESARLRAEWLPRLERRLDVSRVWLDDPRVVHLHYDELVHRTEATLERVASHARLRERPNAPTSAAVQAGLRRITSRLATSGQMLRLDGAAVELDPLLR